MASPSGNLATIVTLDEFIVEYFVGQGLAGACLPQT